MLRAVRKIVLGVLWFFALWLGALTIGGVAVGVAAGARVEEARQGYSAGHAAGAEFDRRYGTALLLGAALVAGVGAASGVLPGTRKKRPSAS